MKIKLRKKIIIKRWERWDRSDILLRDNFRIKIKIG